MILVSSQTIFTFKLSYKEPFNRFDQLIRIHLCYILSENQRLLPH